MRCAVLGAGSWGTALGGILAAKGWPVTVWDIDLEVLEDIRISGRNSRYLPGIDLPGTLTAEAALSVAVADAQLVVLVVPSHVTRRVAEQLGPHLHPDALVCCAAKGIEIDTLQTMSGVLHEVLPTRTHPQLTFLSGPSFAVEVARHLPTAVTVAGTREAARRAVQEAFSGPSFRVYTSEDVMGVEVAGCVKNVVAIASGMCDGLGFGANARAALITRGLVEITRLAVAMGAQPVTLAGLSGMGDLILTCSSELSRNYRVGRGLGRGRPLGDVVAELGQVAEGVVNARSTLALARRHQVDMPISAAVHAVLYEGLSAREAATALMTRALKPETDG
ncbi:MAG: NAD(P)-dependent glycerol-3-phosphate dehydrogenase [Kineosporiaceae bacterium]|nr:NAD(P)-dependent glycerol-3-phosphate dehydrogenase [Kineosporiaceae bacterium]